MTSIDELDVSILGLLTTDARAAVADLATTLGVSRNTIQLRLRRLEDSAILGGFRPIINLPKVGLSVQALISIEIDQQRMREIVNGLGALPEVLEVKIQAGREDILAHVAIASLGALQELTAAIVAVEGVRKTTSTFSVATPVPYRVQPLLEKIAHDSGWGRSTPAPH